MTPATDRPSSRVARRHSLKWHIILTLSVTLLSLLLLVTTAALMTLWPSYQQIEEDEAERNLLRVERAIDNSLHNLSVLVSDWANWDDTYNFLKGEYPGYIEANMMPEAFSNVHLDSIVLLDTGRAVVWSGQLTEERQVAPVSDELLQPMLSVMEDQTKGYGLSASGGQVYLFAWQQVLDSANTQPSNGTLLMLRRLDEQQLQSLRTQLDLPPLNMQVRSVEDSQPYMRLSRLQDRLLRHNELQLPLADPRYSLRLAFESQRQITQLASASLQAGGMLILGGSLFCVLVVFWQIQRLICRPLAELASCVTQLSEDPAQLSSLNPLSQRQDEIGTLAREVRDMHLRILNLSNLDPLTGLPNRRHFDQALNDLLLNASARRPFSLCFIDLDGFKPVNDQFGHKTGDLLLQELARRMSNHLRDNDTLARIGGDEFVLILDNVQQDGPIRQILDSLLQDIAQVSRINDYPIRISGSVGVASYPQDARDLPSLLLRADLAMYQSKQQGGNRITFASAVCDEGIQDSAWQHKRHLRRTQRGLQPPPD